MTSEAIVIGINGYKHLQHLKYAQHDARAVAKFLKEEAHFDQVYYFAEDAEPVNGVSMEPTQNNLRRIMETRVTKRGLGDGDNFWFFFSGHGMRHEERDFLMPIDGYAENVAASGISTAQVSEWLRGCGADNVVMVLDACRSGGIKDGKGIGDETKEGCRQTGVISLFSCSPNQYSYELEEHQQGAFTKVLLEGLGVQGGCATVARLDEYLKRRVPEVVRESLGDRVSQVPYSIAEPINKAHFILMSKYSRPEDLNDLKMDAFRAEKVNNLRLAYQCWLRVNIASGGTDGEAVVEIAKLYPKVSASRTQLSKQTISKSPSEVPLGKGGSNPRLQPDRLRLDLFEFVTCKVNERWKIVDRTAKTAQYFRQDLGKCVGIDMVAIPGGKFRNIQIPEFFMSKTLITQEQWEQVSRLPRIKIELKLNPSQFKGSKHPVEKVNWWMAEEFCERLSIATPQDYQLPAEAQWEYACRSGTITDYYFGDTLSSEVANFDTSETTEVEKYPPNDWGLYDMHGNVWEWCADHHSSDFETALKDSNPILSKDLDSVRVLRGGSWLYDPQYCASSYRDYLSPANIGFYGRNHVGFRVACSSPRA